MKLPSFPNALTIVVAFILAAGVLTYVIPKGEYQRAIDPDTKREVVVPGSYKLVDVENLSPFEILVCIPRGIGKGVEVMVLIFLVGGCLFIVEKTGALKEGVLYFTSKVKGKEEFALVLMGFLFAAGGATEGLEEEIIPLIPVLLIFTRNLGYSPIVTVGVSYGAAVIGASFSPINPFGVVIAQKIAEVPFLLNGIFRMIVFVFAFAVWMVLLIRYANMTRMEKQDVAVNVHKFSNRNAIILSIVMLAFIVLIYGMLSLGWGFNEISAEFFIAGIIMGLLGRLGVNGTFLAYIDGLKSMTFAAMIGGLAYAIPLVLKDGFIIDSIIYGLFTPLQYASPILSAIGMMCSQAFLHLLIPSYSGQAILTMPILAPLS
ncbi:MAG: YfcC family protein, partial [Bacteroidia bacterium]|nr:YfcC family protein [Bacteroidia bacterium]